MPGRDLAQIAYVDAEHALVLQSPVDGDWERPSGHPLSSGGGVGDVGAWDDVESAIKWGRRRAPKVVLRVDRFSYAGRVHRGDLAVYLRAPVVGSYCFYSAGAELVTDDDLEVEPWPGAGPDAGLSRELGYGGKVFLRSSIDAGELEATTTFSVRSERIRGGHMVVKERAHGLDQDSAVAWACERAPIVLVCLGAMDFQYFSAGALHLDELDMPTWDDRWGTPEPMHGPDGEVRGWTRPMKQGRRFPIDGSPDPDIQGWTY